MHRVDLLDNSLTLILRYFNLPLKFSPNYSLHILSPEWLIFISEVSLKTLFSIYIENFYFYIHFLGLTFQIFFAHIKTNIKDI